MREPSLGFQIQGEGGGHCVFKWILRGHLNPTPRATIEIMFEVISIKFWQFRSTIDAHKPISSGDNDIERAFIRFSNPGVRMWWIVKFGYSEKTTKIWLLNLPLFI